MIPYGWGILLAAIAAAPFGEEPQLAPILSGSGVTRRLSLVDERHATLRAQQESSFFRVLGWGTWTTAGTDIASTGLALSRPGVRESNPVWTGRPLSLAAVSHVAGAWAVNYTTARIYRSGAVARGRGTAVRRRTAIAIRLGVVAAWGYVTARNLRLYARS